MGETHERKQQWRRAIYAAQRDAKQIPAPSATFGPLSLDEAYEVQLGVLDERVRAGERQLGWKVGATSFAILEQMKGILDAPMFGFVTSGSLRGERGEVRRSDFFSLGIEPEIGVVLREPLRGPGITPVDAARAVGDVVALVELLDCRLEAEGRTVPDGAADNSNHGGLLQGSLLRPGRGFDFVHEGVVVRVNGRLWGSACGVEALGSPLHVVAWLANELARFDRGMDAGELVSTGSLTRILSAEVGDLIDVSFANLGSIQFALVD
jgi:2-keto-4-pentenoate hydratase